LCASRIIKQAIASLLQTARAQVIGRIFSQIDNNERARRTS
jgi:hypothetical protein